MFLIYYKISAHSHTNMRAQLEHKNYATYWMAAVNFGLADQKTIAENRTPKNNNTYLKEENVANNCALSDVCGMM